MTELARAAGFAAPTWEGIVDLANEIDEAAVITGSRGLEGVHEIFKGSLSHQRVVRAKRPVLMVPAPAWRV
jgi:nucleotide-binding universal stress UspA family protein